MVDKDGILIASGATFIGTITASAGLIGGFASDDHSLRGSNFFLSGSASGNDRFISTSNFNVKASGDITGSQVLFTGGKIADFTIDGTKLKQGSAFNLDGAADADFFISSSNFQVTPSGQVTGSSALFNGDTDISGTTTIGGNLTVNGTGTIASFGLTETAISSSNNKLILKSSGQITASDAQISGKITATSGEIGGFAITSNAVSSSNGNLRLK